MSVFIRIGLRYLAGLLVGYGLLSQDISDMLSNDPDIVAAVEIAVGAAIGGVAELWYYLARRFGWSV